MYILPCIIRCNTYLIHKGNQNSQTNLLRYVLPRLTFHCAICAAVCINNKEKAKCALIRNFCLNLITGQTAIVINYILNVECSDYLRGEEGNGREEQRGRKRAN